MRIVKLPVVFLILIFSFQSSFSQPRRKSAGATRAGQQSNDKKKKAVELTRAVIENRSPGNEPSTSVLKNLASQAESLDKNTESPDPQTAARQWAFSKQVFAAFYQQNKENLIVAPFADVMNQLIKLTYLRRAEAGRNKNINFAGDFSREMFFYAAQDIVRNPQHWRNPLTRDELTIIVQKNYDCNAMSLGAGLLTTIMTNGNSAAGADVAVGGMIACFFQVTPSTALGFVGQHHFDEHLTPGFYKHFQKVFGALARNNSNNTPAELTLKFKQRIDAIRKEHEAQLTVNKASYFAAKDLPGIDLLSALMAVKFIPPRAAALRESTFQTVIVDLREKGDIDASVAADVLDYISTTAGIPATGGNSFIVGQFLNTRLRIQRGDVLRIDADGTINVSTFAMVSGSGKFASSPSGIAEQRWINYSIFQKYPHGALLGRITKTVGEEWQLIGKGKRLTANTSGTLELLVNDGDPSNNSGFYNVRVNINGARGGGEEPENEKPGNEEQKGRKSDKKSVDKQSGKAEQKDSKEKNDGEESKTKKTLKKIWDKIKKPK